MQDEQPKADPRLQKTNPGPTVTTGLVNPCVLYLEATEAGEVPVLYACWARSSNEVREIGGITRLKLTTVVVLKGKPIKQFGGWSMKDGKTSWNFTTYSVSELQLKKDASGWKLDGLIDYNHFQNHRAYGHQGSLKFLDQESDALLHKLYPASSRIVTAVPGHPPYLFAEKVLIFASVKWPSLLNARASFQIKPKPQYYPRRSIFKKLLQAVLGKKKLVEV